MRHIRKHGAPRELIQWKADNQNSPQNLVYNGGGFPAEAIRQSLLAEQGHLCAYTLRRLKTATECHKGGHSTSHSCHIEHIWPQSRYPEQDIDYQNMVACYPPSSAGIACDYGAQKKADFDPGEGGFVSPLHPGVESHFAYAEDGTIHAKTSEGDSTIRILGLDDPSLEHDRQSVIKGWLHPQSGRTLKAQQARRLMQELQKPDAQQCLQPYCTAIIQVLEKHALREEQRAARLKRRKGNA